MVHLINGLLRKMQVQDLLKMLKASEIFVIMHTILPTLIKLM